MKTQLFTGVLLLLITAFSFQDTSDARKKEFLNLLRTLPTKGEFYTEEAIRKAKPFLPVLLSLTEKDIEKYNDIYPFAVLSGGLAIEKENRVYVRAHFAEIRHPELKLFWAALLLKAGDVSEDVVCHLRDALKQPERAQLLAEMVGPEFKFFKRKVLSHPYARENGLMPTIEDEGHADWVVSVAFSPDGATLVSGSHDGTLILWSVTSGKLLRSIEDHRLKGRPFEVVSVAFSHDGKKLASASSDQTARVWDAATGAQTWKFANVTSAHQVIFSPNDNLLAVANCNTVMVWNLSSGILLRTFRKAQIDVGGTYCAKHVAFLNNDDLLADGGPIQIWRVSTGKELRRFDSLRSGLGMALSSDGTKLVLGHSEGYLGMMEVWDVATGKIFRRFPGQANPVESVGFAPDAKIVASENHQGNDIRADGFIDLWDLNTGKKLRRLSGHKSRVAAIAFSPDGKTLASGSWDHSVKLWDVATGKEIRSFPPIKQ